jgi:hypothetical protein
MADENTNSGQTPESTQTPAAAPSAPSTSPADAFGASDAPSWVQSDPKLIAAHKAAGEPQAVPAAKPAVQPSALAAAQPQGVAQPAAVPAPAQTNFKEMTDAIAAGIARGQQPQAQPQQQSDAELAKQLGIYTATPEVYEAIVGVKAERPEQVAALNGALQGVARQAVTIAKVLIDNAMKEQQTSFSPYFTMLREQEGIRQREQFFKEKPELAGYEPLVRQQYDLAMASGVKFATIEEARAHIANKTLESLKAIGITPVAKSVSSTQNRTTPAPARTMSPTSMGGRSGGQTSTKASDTMTSVWGQK